MSPAQIMLFYLTKKVAADRRGLIGAMDALSSGVSPALTGARALVGRTPAPLLVGLPVAGATYAGATAAGQDPIGAGSEAGIAGILGGSLATKSTRHGMSGKDFGLAQRHLRDAAEGKMDLSRSPLWKLNPQTGAHEFSFHSPTTNRVETVSSADPELAHAVLSPLASRARQDTWINDVVKQKLGLGAAAAGVEAASYGAGLLGKANDIAGTTKEKLQDKDGKPGLLSAVDQGVRDVVNTSTGTVKQVGQDVSEGVKSLRKNVDEVGQSAAGAAKSVEQGAGAVANAANETTPAMKALTGALGGVQSLTQDAGSTLKNIDSSVSKVTSSADKASDAVTNLGSGVKDTAKSVDDISKSFKKVTDFVTSPEAVKILKYSAGGAAVLGLGYLLYKSMSDEDEAPAPTRAPRAPRSAGPRIRYAPADHSHPELQPA